MLTKARKYTDNSHFSESLKITISAVVPFLLLMPYEQFNWAFAAALGAMLTAPVDIPSNLKDKCVGLIVGAFTVPAVTLTLSLADGHWYFYPIFVFILFSLSMISVYGHRANMLSFTGLLAASLGLAHTYSGKDLLMHCLMLLLGGLLYLLVAIIFYFARPRRYGVLQTSECMTLTAKYLRYRAKLWSDKADSEKIVEELLTIQVSLNEVHENLREFLIRNKANSGNSSNNRRLLVAFSTLVEILEIAASTSFDHQKIKEYFKDRPDIIADYQVLAINFSKTIEELSEALNMGLKYESKYDLTAQLHGIQAKLSDFASEETSADKVEAIVLFTNVLHYAQSQISKVYALEKSLIEKAFTADVKEKFKDLEKFLTPVHYRWETLRENLNFTSTIFRHATRLTLTILIGFLIGKAFSLLNAYWILLTIVVIMRPGFGLTKQRAFERVIGTVIGGLLALGLLTFVSNISILAYLTVITMIIGYWFSHTDYKVGVTFITMYVILIYAILTPDFMDLLVFRIVDTVIGAALAFAANYLLWPSWEFLNVNTHLSKSVKANKEYVKEISLLYNEKGEVTLPYKLARKYAFIEIGNLMASFQRMIQEPKSKQTLRAEIYELAVLNHTFLSTTASIGIYVQHKHTTKASKAFNVVIDYIIKNLSIAVKLLEQNKTIVTEKPDTGIVIEEYNVSLQYLKDLREYELKKKYTDDEKIKNLMEESVLVIEQLMWLSQLSEKIVKLSRDIAEKRNELQKAKKLHLTIPKAIFNKKGSKLS